MGGRKTLKRLAGRLFNLLLLGLLLSCGGGQVDPENYNYPEIPRVKPSYLHLPVDISLDELEELVNSRIKTMLLDKKEIDAGKVTIHTLQVKRFGDVQLSGEGGHLDWTVPLQIKLSASPQHKLLQFDFLKDKFMRFSTLFYLQSTFSLTGDYHLKTKTELVRYEWEEEPALNFGNVNIGLTSVIAKQIEQHKHELMSKLDSLILAEVAITRMLNRVWVKLQRPLPLDKSICWFWLKINADKISMGDVFIYKDALQVPMRIDARLHVSVSDSLPSFEMVGLPQIHRLKTFQDDFDLNLLAVLHYDKLNEFFNETLGGKQFVVSGEQLVLENVNVFGKGRKLGVEVTVSGSTEATVEFEGIPEFDKGSEVLEVKEFQYAVTRSDWLTSAADYVYGEEFKEIISTMLYFPVGSKLLILPELLQDALNRGEKGVRRSFEIDQMVIMPEKPLVHKEALYIEVRATGKAELQVNELRKKPM